MKKATMICMVVVFVFCSSVKAKKYSVSDSEGLYDALQDASSGDVIELAPGTYEMYEDQYGVWHYAIEPLVDDITITSEDPDDSYYVENTIISGKGSEYLGPPQYDYDYYWGSCCVFQGTSGCELVGLTIMAGPDDDDYNYSHVPLSFGSRSGTTAVGCLDSNPTIDRCRIIGGTKENDNQHCIFYVFTENNNVDHIMDISDCEIGGLSASSSSAMLVAGDISVGSTGTAKLNIEDCDIIDNKAYGIRVDLGSDADLQFTIDRCTISDNGSNGILLQNTGNSVSSTIRGCEITGNGFEAIPIPNGGGIYIMDNAVGTIESCNFIGNKGAYGGGLNSGNSASEITVKGCRFEDNTAASEGGGAYSQDTDIEFIDCEFIGNEAVMGGGIGHTQKIKLSNCTIERNTATGANDSYGGGIYSPWGGLTMANCVVLGNTADSNGAGIAMDNGGDDSSYVNCTISGNHSDANGGGIALMSTDEYSIEIEIHNCIIWGNSDIDGRDESSQLYVASDTVDTFNVDYSCIFGLDAYLTEYNINTNPSFEVEGWLTEGAGDLSFDGDGDYISLSANAVTGTEFTVCAWAYQHALGGGDSSQNIIFCQRDDDTGDNKCAIVLMAEREAAGTAYAGIRSSSGSLQFLTADRKPYKQWHHYAMTVDSDYFRFYIDGVEAGVTSNNQMGNYATNIDYRDIGRHRYSDKNGGFFNGVIKDVRVYDTALLDENIQFIYDGGGTDPGSYNLVGHWELHDGSGTTAYDSAGDPANDGTIEGDAEWLHGWQEGDYNLKIGSGCIDSGDTDAALALGLDKDIDDDPRIVDGDGDLEAEVDMGAQELQKAGAIISHWKLDEGSGPTAYDSAGDNDGTITGDPVWISGQIDGALSFDGDDNVITGAIMDFRGDGTFTVSLWIRATITQDNYIIGTGLGEGWYMRVTRSTFSPPGRLLVKIDDGRDDEWGAGGPVINDDKWHHIVMVLDGPNDKMYGYVDGDPAINVDLPTGKNEVGDLLDTVYIGSTEETSRYFRGDIDDVRIYNGALSEEEIATIYMEGLGL